MVCRRFWGCCVGIPGACANNRAVSGGAIKQAHIKCFRPQAAWHIVQAGEMRTAAIERHQASRHDFTRGVGLCKPQGFVGMHGEAAHPEMVMVPECLVPGYGLIQPNGLKGPLIVNIVHTKAFTRARRNNLAVKHINIPAQLIILSGIAHIAQRYAKIKRRFFMQRVYSLNGRIQHLRGVQHNRRIYGRRKIE